MDRFAPYLKKDYPEAVLDLYRKSVDQFASQTGRNIYHQVVGYLKKMQGYQGGDLVVKKMVQEFQLKYKNRRAMMEVLNKSFK